MDYSKRSLEIHQKLNGKIEVKSKVKLKNRNDLSIAYTPGVAAVSIAIAKNQNQVHNLTIKANSVAVVSDGSAVLGLGNIGPFAALPVMEGKCLLFKELAGIDAYPIVLSTQNPQEIIQAVSAISATFGGINLEDIAAPKCFEVEEKLKKILNIPVFHDDQHGTAIVVTAALKNALKVLSKKLTDIKVVINGAGAAGLAIANLLIKLKVGELIILDSKGVIYKGRQGMNNYKQELAKTTNKNRVKGGLKEALSGADVFIGVSVANILKPEHIKLMNNKPIIFAMANPIPEIMPDQAIMAGAVIVATGRSDFPNQINNVLAFPGVFRGALDAKAEFISDEMKLAAVTALTDYLKHPTSEKIIPSPLDKRLVIKIAQAVAKSYSKSTENHGF